MLPKLLLYPMPNQRNPKVPFNQPTFSRSVFAFKWVEIWLRRKAELPGADPSQISQEEDLSQVTKVLIFKMPPRKIFISSSFFDGPNGEWFPCLPVKFSSLNNTGFVPGLLLLKKSPSHIRLLYENLNEFFWTFDRELKKNLFRCCKFCK